MANYTINLSDAQVAMINKLLATRPGKTFGEELDSCVEFGIKNRMYRSERNARVYQQTKQEDALIDDLTSGRITDAVFVQKLRDLQVKK